MTSVMFPVSFHPENLMEALYGCFFKGFLPAKLVFSWKFSSTSETS